MIRSIKFFKNNFSILSKQKKIPLGRWERSGNIDIKVDLANHDSCGGPLCSLPPNNINVDNKNKKSLNINDEELKYLIIPGCYDLYPSEIKK
jgi:hypothetical protein